LLLIAAPLTGWLPGPGGIPLFIAGLAVLASEFEWAQRVLYKVKDWVKALTTWTGKQPAWLKTLGTVALFICVLIAIWLYLAVLGVPGWFPDSWERLLAKLPLLP
jgi:putative transmembrane protein PGPGW